MLSSLCTNIRHVRRGVLGHPQLRHRVRGPRDHDVRQDPEQAATSGMADLLGHGFCQSIDMIAAAMGWELDAEKHVVHETAVATEPIETPVGVLEPGTVAAQRFRWQGTVDGDPVITAAVNWLGRARRTPAPPRGLRPRGPALRDRLRRRPAPRSPSTACTPPPSTRASSATPASWPRPCTRVNAVPCDATPTRGSRPASTCRSFAGRAPATVAPSSGCSSCWRAAVSCPPVEHAQDQRGAARARPPRSRRPRALAAPHPPGTALSGTRAAWRAAA